jgi:uncharacterized protein (DUF1684 family)
MSNIDNPLALAHWRQKVAEMYAAVRRAPPAGRHIAWQDWRASRNDLFRFHEQSPLDNLQKNNFSGLSYFDYDPDWHVVAKVEYDVPQDAFAVDLGEDGAFLMKRFGRATFSAKNHELGLSLFWIEGYGGGLFIPFRDKTNRGDSYGGGRYLFDTLKGVDIGVGEGNIIFDFNYAYNPSCAYNPRWVCPLSPVENQLPIPVAAGEKTYSNFPGVSSTTDYQKLPS